jgi:ribonuclease P protein component
MDSLPRKLTSFSKQEIDTLFAHSKLAFKSNGLIIYKAPATHSYGKILLIVPAKSGTAPQRNLIKRRLKSIFYERELYKRGYDLAISVRKEAMELPFTMLQTLLEKATA